jgi:hypothetical protein
VLEVHAVGFVPSTVRPVLNAAKVAPSCEPWNVSVAAVNPVTLHVIRQPEHPALPPVKVGKVGETPAAVKVKTWEQFDTPCA